MLVIENVAHLELTAVVTIHFHSRDATIIDFTGTIIIEGINHGYTIMMIIMNLFISKHY